MSGELTFEDVLSTVALHRGAFEDHPRDTIRPTAGQPPSPDLLERLVDAQRQRNVRPSGETLGSGGMGLVQVAEQPTMGRMVAVKTLKSNRVTPQSDSAPSADEEKAEE